MEPLKSLSTEQAYKIVEFIGYKKHEVISNVYILKNKRMSFNLKSLIIYDLDEYGAMIDSTKKIVDYRYFISELTKIHPQKMRSWKIKNIILK